MFKDFLKKITDWTLEKEEEAAKNCAIPIDTIEKQISVLETKKEELIKRCEEQKKEFDSLLERLEKIKNIEKLRCETKNDSK